MGLFVCCSFVRPPLLTYEMAFALRSRVGLATQVARRAAVSSRMQSAFASSQAEKPFLDKESWNAFLDDSPLRDMAKELYGHFDANRAETAKALKAEPKPDKSRADWEKDGTNAFLAKSNAEIIADLHAHKAHPDIPRSFVVDDFASPQTPLPEFNIDQVIKDAISNAEDNFEKGVAELLAKPDVQAAQDDPMVARKWKPDYLVANTKLHLRKSKK